MLSFCACINNPRISCVIADKLFEGMNQTVLTLNNSWKVWSINIVSVIHRPWVSATGTLAS